MKKKIIFAVATSLFAIATVFNMNVLQSNNAGDVSLESLMSIANATPEMDGGMLPEATCYGSSTYNSSTGIGSATILWLQIWFSDPYNPTGDEIENMEEDLRKPRSQQKRTFTNNSGSHSAGGTGGWNKGFVAEANYNYTFPTNSNSVNRVCCGDDHFERCTHLPPCESYVGMS